MKILIEPPKFLSKEGLKSLIVQHGPHSKFLGSWSVKTKGGGWSDLAIDVVYLQKEEKLNGYFRDILTNKAILADVRTSFIDQFMPCFVDSPIVYVSKYRHDYVSTDSGFFIDGGRDYLRTNAPVIDYLYFDIKHGQFLLTNEAHTSKYFVDIEYI